VTPSEGEPSRHRPGPGDRVRRRRVIVAAAAASFTPWKVSSLLAWDTWAAIFCTWVWVAVRGADATTHRIATRGDDPRPAADLVLIAASVASLLGVGLALLQASDYGDFAYVAFTLGMTYQVSDADLTSKKIRTTAPSSGPSVIRHWHSCDLHHHQRRRRPLASLSVHGRWSDNPSPPVDRNDLDRLRRPPEGHRPWL
jgi:hypothetical protein